MANINEWTTVSHNKKQKPVLIKQVQKPINKCKKTIGAIRCKCCILVERCEITLAWNDANFKPNDYKHAGICDNDRLERMLEYKSQWKKGFTFITQIQDQYEVLSFDGKTLIANQWCAHNDTLNHRNAKNTLMNFNGRSVRIILK